METIYERSGHPVIGREATIIFCYSPGMVRRRKTKHTITLVGAGSLAHALGPALKDAGYVIDAIASRSRSTSKRRAAGLAKKLNAELVMLDEFQPNSHIIWLCHTDDALAQTARLLASKQGWQGKIVLHSSGALSSDVLAPLKRAGAVTASLHPMMTFVPGAAPAMADVPFAVEGDRKAVEVARKIVKAFRAEVFELKKEAKVLYHALGSFSSPLIVATLVTAERVGRAVGLRKNQIAKIMRPILEQTIRNYLGRGAAAAFSGPIKRGDLNTVRGHLRDLQRVAGAGEVYRALVKSALMDLPSGNKKGLLLTLSRSRETSSQKKP